MLESSFDSPKGILRSPQGEKKFHLSLLPPTGDLDFFVEYYWIVSWDLKDQGPYVQETLPYPSVHLVFEAHPEITRVDDIVCCLNLKKRTLQRLFSQYVGVSPKWVIKRYRLHEVAARLAEGEVIDSAEIALELGYFDQAHFIKDFKAIVG